MDIDLKDTEQGGDAENNAKRSYEPPTLTVHGTVAELTRGSNKGTADGLTGSLIAA